MAIHQSWKEVLPKLGMFAKPSDKELESAVEEYIESKKLLFAKAEVIYSPLAANPYFRLDTTGEISSGDMVEKAQNPDVIFVRGISYNGDMNEDLITARVYLGINRRISGHFQRDELNPNLMGIIEASIAFVKHFFQQERIRPLVFGADVDIPEQVLSGYSIEDADWWTKHYAQDGPTVSGKAMEGAYRVLVARQNIEAYYERIREEHPLSDSAPNNPLHIN